MRFVDFDCAFSYESSQLMHYFLYFKSLSNLYDLEVFQNKISSSALTVATLEKNVLSGVPFWEESEDALFEDNSPFDLEDDPIPKNGEGSHKLSLLQDIGYKNDLSNLVMDKMA